MGETIYIYLAILLSLNHSIETSENGSSYNYSFESITLY